MAQYIGIAILAGYGFEYLKIGDPSNPVLEHELKFDDGDDGAELVSARDVARCGKRFTVSSFNDDSLTQYDIDSAETLSFATVISDGDGGADLDGAKTIICSPSHLYVTARVSSAVSIFSIGADGGLSYAAKITTALSDPNSVALSENNNVLYVANQGNATLTVYDVSNPASPIHLKTISDGDDGGKVAFTGPSDVKVLGDVLAVADYDEASVIFFDITNPENPVAVGSVVDATNLNGAGRLAWIDSTYIAATAFLDNSVQIIDYGSVPASPSIIANVDNGDGGAVLNRPINILHYRGFLYVSAFISDALECIDVTDPTAPAHHDSLADGAGGALLDGPEGMDLYYHEGAFTATRSGNTLNLATIAPNTNWFLATQGTGDVYYRISGSGNAYAAVPAITSWGANAISLPTAGLPVGVLDIKIENDDGISVEALAAVSIPGGTFFFYNAGKGNA